jgi:hypothetical protein
VAALQAGLYGVGNPPQASISHYVGLDVSMKETAICIVDERARGQGRDRARSHCRVPGCDRIGFRADQPRGGAVSALVVRRPGRGWSAGDLHRRPAHEGGGERHVREDRPDRRPQHRVRDAGGLVPAGTPEGPGSEEAPVAAGSVRGIEARTITLGQAGPCGVFSVLHETQRPSHLPIVAARKSSMHFSGVIRTFGTSLPRSHSSYSHLK